MSRRAGSAIFVLSFALVPWGLEACGRAANVLEGDLGTGGDPLDGSDSPGGAGGFGGAGTGGTGRTGGSKAAAGVRVPLGTGGILGPGGGPATGGTPSAGGGPATLTNAETRRLVVDLLCTLTAKFPCLSLEVSGAPSGATLEQKQELCRQATLRSYESTIGDHCFTEWYENAVCAVGYTGYCPCTPDAGQVCSLTPETHDYGPPCGITALKLEFCARSEPSGVVEGAAGKYEWFDDERGCVATGLARNGVDRIESVCSGATGAAQRCTCSANGVQLNDATLNLTGGDHRFFVENCKAVATELASGRCSDILDCCYDFIEDGFVEDCVCGSDPRAAGYASCAELAAAQKAVVVDHCDIYRPPTRP